MASKDQLSLTLSLCTFLSLAWMPLIVFIVTFLFLLFVLTISGPVSWLHSETSDPVSYMMAAGNMPPSAWTCITSYGEHAFPIGILLTIMEFTFSSSLSSIMRSFSSSSWSNFFISAMRNSCCLLISDVTVIELICICSDPSVGRTLNCYVCIFLWEDSWCLLGLLVDTS